MAYGTYLVPSDTATVLGQHVKNSRNLGLTLQRYVPQEAIDETDRLNDRGRPIGKERNFWLQDICREFKPDTALIESTYRRWLAMTEGAARLTLVSRSRMIIGLGGKGALELGITLHPVTGLPYIPGSALKGLCRNYTLYYIAAESGISLDPAAVKDPSEAARQLDEQLTATANYGLNIHPEYAALYRALFGKQEEAGQCVFYDAVIQDLPSDRPLFVLDVMTPHFRQYYESNGATAPHDADNPNPITYITVNAGIMFAFAVGSRRTARQAPTGDALYLLDQALREWGIGAKTAAGYGLFKRVKGKKSA